MGQGKQGLEFGSGFGDFTRGMVSETREQIRVRAMVRVRVRVLVWVRV